ncbi:rhomboid family intramembrane serine protease [Halapricum sp. CBA1109]|uniref:rhomboid family intramembrane serine protease n=1 Tax=Halapricum sp. CBA1109 TaxID=2668068 RepID=UPI0012FA22D7|nr:rhomboid family intramembrane serine protease [Halapricum sp. CBA1109]MUV89278.1 rhomboid family intramembrane serine protease [Halapricum sp. CBA1109]
MSTPTLVALTLALLVVAAFAWYWDALDWWRLATEDRFYYGVPWGTALTTAVVVTFYLFAQGGLSSWSDPLTFPFVSWSYFYPFGILTSGIAHGSPSHIVGNMTATVVFAAVAEYAWGHYPPARRDDGSMLTGGTRLRDRPVVRALVVPPAAMFAVAVLTALFSFGPALGFSGAVFGLVGFVLVTRPRAGVVAVVVTAALGTLLDAFTAPVVRGTISSGAPGPPSWASIAFQAHMLGFLLGVAAGASLLAARGRRPSPLAVLGATLLVGLVQSLWLIAFPAQSDVWVLYRGAGVSLVALLAVVVTVAASGREDIPYLSVTPSRWLLSAGWLLLVTGLYGLLLLLLTVVGDASAISFAAITVAILPLVVPGIYPLADRRWATTSLSTRGTAIGAVLVGALLVASPALLYGPITVDDASVTDTGEVTVEDYTLTYGENLSSGQQFALLGDIETNQTVAGVAVVSEQRSMWTLGARESTLSYQGNATVTVGGLGWRETVEANRTGWSVAGNDSVYAVDLVVEDDRTRSFRADPRRADGRIDGHNVTVAATTDGFEVRLSRNDETVATAAVPEVNGTASLGPLTAVTDRSDGSTTLAVESGDTRLVVAERETYN